MEPGDLETAASFCQIVQSADLLEYLGLPRDATGPAVSAALAERRRRLQGMQNNPKYRESARFLLKRYQALTRVAADPATHLEHARLQREADLLPTLQMAIDSVLANGTLTDAEEQFVRRAALSLGVSQATYERVLRERAGRAGVRLQAASVLPPPVWKGGPTAPVRQGNALREAEVQGAAEHPWWDAGFTRLLLQVIPGGPGEMVDLYCRGGTSALTLLPLRPQLAWLGLDRNPARVALGHAAVAPFGERARVERARPSEVPLPESSVDYVLAVRALTYHADTGAVLADTRRVLRQGGRALVAEPDGLAETFYFEGHLDAYNAAFHALGRSVDEAMRAAGRAGSEPSLALGPRLARRLADAGLAPVSTAVHGAGAFEVQPFRRVARKLRRYPRALARAAGLPGDHPGLRAVEAEVDILEARIPAKQTGLGGHVLPMFLTVGVRED